MITYTAGNYIAQGLPNIEGSYTPVLFVSSGGGYLIGNMHNTGAFSEPNETLSTVAGPAGGTSITKNCGFNFKASNSNSVYGSSERVQPNSVTTIMLIKY